jgi:hypothetical protein
LIAADFFTTEVSGRNGLVTFYTLFVIELRSRLVHVCDTTVSPNGQWMRQIARQLTNERDGCARGKTQLIIDRDTKHCEGFRQILEAPGIEIVLCPPRVPRCRNHQGMENKLLTPQFLPLEGEIRCEKRLGGLLKYYYRKAA